MSQKRKPLPAPDATDCGCKVSWNFYRDKKVAETAAKIAGHNAKLDEALGYDFGFQMPGAIELVKAGEHAGMYRVTCP